MPEHYPTIGAAIGAALTHNAAMAARNHTTRPVEQELGAGRNARLVADMERLGGYLTAARRACGAPSWPDVPRAIRRLVVERERGVRYRLAWRSARARARRAEATVARVLAWCDDLDALLVARHMDPYAEHPHAVALRELISRHPEDS
ncbi:hypothetical protein [Streptomyces sp. NPDC094032]|uniref:hypothetical protein n=1 Tax=Streptomyces sp. NPDC094032 TaxID=3155308 RepID=UPI00331A0EAF